MSQDFVLLASGSPRRRELLQQIGVSFRLIGAPVDESLRTGESAKAYVARLAAAKADAGWHHSRDSAAAPVLAADTAVVLDDKILGKPTDRADAGNMLRLLSGRTHEVLTAVALRSASGIELRVSVSEVTFRTIDAEEMQSYWDTGEPADKAGGYAIQGRAAIFVAGLVGSYSGVMGLPLFETAQLLRGAGIPHWQGTCGNGS